MSVTDWNWRLPVDLQDLPWDCSATSLSWCLRSIGRSETEADVVAGLGPARISPVYGLLDASGAGIVEYLAELGIGSANNPSATFQEVWDAAGHQPMVIGGRAWGHWVAVRLPRRVAGSYGYYEMWLMNPAPGYKNVFQTLSDTDFQNLGAFSAVWFTSW